MRTWIEINLKEHYAIFKDKPKKKVPIGEGKIILKNKKLIIKFELIGGGRGKLNGRKRMS